MKVNIKNKTRLCVCGRSPTIEYFMGAMLWRPACRNPSCTEFTHEFPLFSNESDAVAAWNMHIKRVKRMRRNVSEDSFI